MDQRHSSPAARPRSPRPSMHRQRSNSMPIVEALGCSAFEAQIILAEGNAAVRSRRARGRRNRKINGDSITTFDPRDHLKYLHRDSVIEETAGFPQTQDPGCYSRNSSGTSTVTVVPETETSEKETKTAPASPLGNYSANLAQFIKAQLNSIPTYQPESESHFPLSPRSCPDLSFSSRTPPQSPKREPQRPPIVSGVLEIPPVRPPLLSAFSAWSSTDDEMDYETLIEPDSESRAESTLFRSPGHATATFPNCNPSANSSFLFPSTPENDDEEEEEDQPGTAKGSTFPSQTTLHASSTDDYRSDEYPSSNTSQPPLTDSSGPSQPSSASASSYFEFKRPLVLDSHVRNRIIAVVTPPVANLKVLSAISPWEGAALSNVHDVFIESQHRVHVDGMTFDMLRDLVVPSRVTTPC